MLGTVPARLAAPRKRACSDEREANALGMVPLSAVNPKYNEMSLVKLVKLGGMVPEIWSNSK